MILIKAVVYAAAFSLAVRPFVKEIRYIQNKKALDNEALLINFDSEDAEKSATKILYQYIAKDENKYY